MRWQRVREKLKSVIEPITWVIVVPRKGRSEEALCSRMKILMCLSSRWSLQRLTGATTFTNAYFVT